MVILKFMPRSNARYIIRSVASLALPPCSSRSSMPKNKPSPRTSQIMGNSLCNSSSPVLKNSPFRTMAFNMSSSSRQAMVANAAAAASADPMTYDQALSRAAASAPSLKARAATTASARSLAVAADRLPDPTLDLGFQNFPVTGPNAER